MFNIIIILAIIVCIGLTLIVLIQNPKGGGIASNFSAGNQIMGVKRTNELVEKITWGLAIALLILALSSNMFISSGSDNAQESSLQHQIETDGLSVPDIAPTTGDFNMGAPAGNPTETEMAPAPEPSNDEGTSEE